MGTCKGNGFSRFRVGRGGYEAGKKATRASTALTAPFDGRGNLKSMKSKKFVRCATVVGILALGCATANSQTSSTTPDPKSVPVIDGGIGPCAADFTITDPAGGPVYAAKIKVHIAYGFMNARKLDLEVGTNADGKARFTGLPERLKHGGLYFEASETDRTGEAFDDPSKTCKAQFTIALQKK